jgi:hypothetical protein
METKDAAFYRARAEECRKGAAKTKDLQAKIHWQQAEQCWLEMAECAERLAKQQGQKQS